MSSRMGNTHALLPRRSQGQLAGNLKNHPHTHSIKSILYRLQGGYHPCPHYLSSRLLHQPALPSPHHPIHTCEPYSSTMSPSCPETSRGSPIPTKVGPNSPDCRLRVSIPFVSPLSPSYLFCSPTIPYCLNLPSIPCNHEHY